MRQHSFTFRGTVGEAVGWGAAVALLVSGVRLFLAGKARQEQPQKGERQPPRQGWRLRSQQLAAEVPEPQSEAQQLEQEPQVTQEQQPEPRILQLEPRPQNELQHGLQHLMRWHHQRLQQAQHLQQPRGQQQQQQRLPRQPACLGDPALRPLPPGCATLRPLAARTRRALDSPKPLRRAQQPWPSSRASANRREVLDTFLGRMSLSASDSDTADDHSPASARHNQPRPERRSGGSTASERAAILAKMPELVLQVCLRWRMTLQDVEALALPSWGFDVTFSDRGAWSAYLREGEHEIRIKGTDFLGEIQGLNIPLPDTRCHIQSARWVELMDGTVLARLMTDGRPTCVMPWAHPSTINGVLSALRRVPWAAEHSWIFPRWHIDRLVFLAWVGRTLRLDPAWSTTVLSFLPMEPKSETQAGEVIMYRSTTHQRWLHCLVTDRDPATSSIMVDVKPGYWITPEEQARCIRHHLD